MADEFPKGAPLPAPTDMVLVLMPERMARLFERRCLTPAGQLTGPLLFSADDLPTYIIGVQDAYT